MDDVRWEAIRRLGVGPVSPSYSVRTSKSARKARPKTWRRRVPLQIRQQPFHLLMVQIPDFVWTYCRFRRLKDLECRIGRTQLFALPSKWTGPATLLAPEAFFWRRSRATLGGTRAHCSDDPGRGLILAPSIALAYCVLLRS